MRRCPAVRGGLGFDEHRLHLQDQGRGGARSRPRSRQKPPTPQPRPSRAVRVVPGQHRRGLRGECLLAGHVIMQQSHRANV